jgi:hypothetical protein
MPELILNDEQAQLVHRADGAIVVRDTQGRVLGRLAPELSGEAIAELKRRASSAGPWYTGVQVQARLQGLQEEWERTGGFDEKRLQELLNQMNAADPGQMRNRVP